MSEYFNQCYDERGGPIGEFDVLRVFHFVGARRKKHYMYKQVRVIEVPEGPRAGKHLYGVHLTQAYDPAKPLEGAYYLGSKDQRLEGVVIVESPDWKKLP